MTLGLKIRRMLKEDGTDSPELIDEARSRREVSDSILEVIYHKILDHYRDEEDHSSTKRKKSARERK